MILRIKGLIQGLLITGILCHTAYAAEVSPSDVSPSPRPSPIKEEGEKVMADVINIPDVVATVGDVKITKEDLETRMVQLRATDPQGFDNMGIEERKMTITRTLDNMIVRELMYQEGIKQKIVVTDEEINKNLEEAKRGFPSEDAFMKALEADKLTIQSWKEEARKNLMAMKLEEMTVDGIKIPDDEIEAYYKRNKKDLNKEDAVKISHILVSTEEEARKVVKELEEKKDFNDLAKEYSLDTNTKDKGGDLGWYIRGELLKEVEDASYSLSRGEISAPIRSGFGYHVIRLDEKRPASEQTLEDHRERIISILRQDKWKKIRFSWLGTLFNDAKIWKWSPGNEDGGDNDFTY